MSDATVKPNLRALIVAMADTIAAHAEELTTLDQAIGDGDHGLNMRRGFEAVRAEADAIAAKPCPDALKAIGTKLVMTVGGASGPLYGTLFMTLGKEWPAEPDRPCHRHGAEGGDRRRGGARQVADRPEDHARRALSGAGGASPMADRRPRSHRRRTRRPRRPFR